MCARKNTKRKTAIEEVISGKMPSRRIDAEREFRRRQDLWALPNDPESLCSAEECLCGSFRKAFENLSADEKTAFSYWLLQIRSGHMPLSEREIRSMSGFISQILGYIEPDALDALISRIQEALAEAISRYS